MIKPQSLTINNDVEMLNDLQKLIGTINWVRLILGISNHELQHLFNLLKGDPDLTSP
ncbi:POK25 protein, partial [Alopecoenas beccarii]|nr:POK25 protein [Alopecoenas beccarii]